MLNEDYSDLGAVTIPEGREYSDLGAVPANSSTSEAEIMAAPPKTVFEKIKGFFGNSAEKDIATAQNVYALSKVTGLEMHDVMNNYEHLRRSSKVTGITPDASNKEYLSVAMLPAIGGAAAFNPIGTAAGVIAFGALDKAIPTENLINKMRSSGVNDEVTTLIETADLVGKTILIGGAFKHGPHLAENFLKQKIVEFKMPSTVRLMASQVRDIFQTGTLTTAEQKQLFAGLNLNSYDLRAAIDHGVDISIPAEKLVTITDRPFWAKIKGAFGAVPETKVTASVAGKAEKAPAGMIEFNQEQIPQELRPLAEEAKKYGTVDEFIKSKIVYHGTREDFDIFDPTLHGKQNPTIQDDDEGIYFTSSKDEAEFYTLKTDNDNNVRSGDNPRIIESYLDFKNPLVVEIKGNTTNYIDSHPKIKDKMVTGKYDGIIVKSKDPEEPATYFVQDPALIKSKQYLADLYNTVVHQKRSGDISAPASSESASSANSISDSFQSTPREFNRRDNDNIQQGNKAVKRIIEAIKSAKDVRPQQEAIYAEARKKKFAKMMAVGSRVSGEKGFYAQLGALKGELPKVEFESIRGKIGQEDIDSLFNMVKDTPKIGEWEKLSAREGLAKLFGEYGGKVPTEGEISLLQEVFGKEFTETVLSKRTFFEKAKDLGIQVANVPRSIMASLDLSAPMRQGVFFIGRPKQFWPSFKRMFGAFKSEESYRALQDSIIANPQYQLARDSGLSLTDMDVILSQREEQFASNLAEKIPVIGRGVRASGRAYIGFLNKLRFDVFADLVNKADALGLDPNKNRDLTKAIAEFINNATGRGTIPGGLQKAATTLNTIFFSPRLIMSRINLMRPDYYIRQKPFVRKEALKSLFSYVAFVSSIVTLAKLFGADVENDSRNSDFGKIKIGNTRIDPWGGFQQLAVAASRIITGKYISSTTGKEMTLGEGFKPMTRADIAWRLLEGKLAPVPSFVVALMKQKNAQGEDVSIPQEIGERFVPMILQDMYDVAQESPGLLPVSMLAIFGLGVQTYKEKGRF